MPTEREKMVRGEYFDAGDPELDALRKQARNLCFALNNTQYGEREMRQLLLKQMFGSMGDGITIQPPFFCDYGVNIHLGSGIFFNFNCVVLDVAPVTIGNATAFGPAVQIYTAMHEMKASERMAANRDFGRPVTIGSRVWVGGAAVILPGVTIGDGSVIGAGSVVTRDIPANVFAAGNPCRVVRALEE
jgi:maltose O-acetyltransferase